jgi:catechol 2,3-dioxygenase-like lactoylglutathione lyase family enzyme
VFLCHRSLSHIVLQTNKPRQLREWYCRVLGAEIVHENDFISFISYDDEHHRVAFLNPGALAPREPGERDDGDFRAGKEAGLHHMAFTFKGLEELLDTYTRLKEIGISPYWCINHGPTTSMYYRDPDNNQVELLIDNLADVRDGKSYMQSPAFAENPIGVAFEPDIGRARRAGVSAAELTGSLDFRGDVKAWQLCHEPPVTKTAWAYLLQCNKMVMACSKASNPNPSRCAIGVPGAGAALPRPGR